MLEIKTSHKVEPQLKMTPLIDMVFLLLVFFLLTTNFITDAGIKVKLPNASSTEPQVEQDITIYVSTEGRIFIREKELSPEQLFNQLRRLIGDDPHKLVIIKADKNVILDKAVKVMDIAKAAGAGRLCIATEKGIL